MIRDGYHMMWVRRLVSPSLREYYLALGACSFRLDTLVVDVCGYS